MAITVGEFISPVGMIDRKIMFPDDTGDEFDARMDAYLQDATARGAGNVLAERAWFYYRAFMDVHLRLVSIPHSASLDEGGSYTYLITQIQLMKDRAEAFKKEFDGLLVVVTKTPVYYGSTSMNTTFSP
jgi:hypothetical protein